MAMKNDGKQKENAKNDKRKTRILEILRNGKFSRTIRRHSQSRIESPRNREQPTVCARCFSAPDSTAVLDRLWPCLTAAYD